MKLRLREKTTATLLIAIFMISAFAIVMPVSALEFPDFRYFEKVWGGDPDVVPLPEGESLAIEVWYEDGFAYFKATIPESYNPETALASFTFDIDNDGIADFQIQYRGSIEGWMYSGVEGSDWVKDPQDTGWLPVPPEFIFTNEGKVFILTLPISMLSSTYKFGFQANGEPGHQLFYSIDPAHLWGGDVYDDYVHSYYYVEMTRPPLKRDFVPGKGKGLDKPLPNDNFAKGRREE